MPSRGPRARAARREGAAGREGVAGPEGAAGREDVARRIIVAAPVVETEAELYRHTDHYLEMGIGGIMVGIGGRHPLLRCSAQSAPTASVVRYITHLTARRPDIIVAMDAEGGSIFNALEHVSPLRAPRDYVERNDRAGFVRDAHRHAELLAAHGVTMNFAPLLDVARPGYRGYPAADRRAWSDDPDVVSDWAALFCDVMHDHGITVVPKHFPGYGGLTTNPHEALATLPADEEARSMQPYFALIRRASVRAIMTGHVRCSLDPLRPASLSPGVESHLRTAIGFDGVTIADELFMGAITDALRTPTFTEAGGTAIASIDPHEPTRAGARMVAALAANDMVIVSYPVQNRDGTLKGNPDGLNRVPRMVEAAATALASGDLSETRHAEALARIERLLAPAS